MVVFWRWCDCHLCEAATFSSSWEVMGGVVTCILKVCFELCVRMLNLACCSVAFNVATHLDVNKSMGCLINSSQPNVVATFSS